MTSLEDQSWEDQDATRPTLAPDEKGGFPWGRVAAIAALLVLALIVSRSCQQAQIRVTKEQAIATAEREVDFEPTLKQIRFLRQGVNRRPFWFVSLSIPIDRSRNTYEKLTVVKVNANTGEVAEVDRQIGGETAGQQEGAGGQQGTGGQQEGTGQQQEAP